MKNSFNKNYFGAYDLERKYNENHDERGRFTSGDGGSGAASRNVLSQEHYHLPEVGISPYNDLGAHASASFSLKLANTRNRALRVAQKAVIDDLRANPHVGKVVAGIYGTGANAQNVYHIYRKTV